MRTLSVLISLIILYLFFLLATIAIGRSRSKRLREAHRRGKRCIRFARVILSRAEYYLVTSQLGMFLVSMITGYVILTLARTMMNLQMFAHYLPALATSDWVLVSVEVALFLAVTFVCFLGRQLVKGIALANPEGVLCALSIPIIVSTRILGPLVTLLNLLAGFLLKPFGRELPQERETAASAEELSEIVDESTEAGELEQSEREMIAGVFSFSDTVVREVMTPRKEVVWCDESTSLQEVVDLIRAQGFSRILVAGRNLDDVKGVLHVKDLLPFFGRQPTDFNLREHVRKPFFVSSEKKIDDVLLDMRREAMHFAIVLDEHGGVGGIVTVEDIIEEIVGEIGDEFDTVRTEQAARESVSGELIVDGSMAIDDFNQTTGFELPHGAYDTIAGFAIHLLGRIPAEAESFMFRGARIVVEQVSQNRIVRMRVVTPKKSNQIKALNQKTSETNASRSDSYTRSSEESSKARASGSH